MNKILGIVGMGAVAAGCWLGCHHIKHDAVSAAAPVAKREEVKVVAGIKDHMADTATYYRDLYNQEHAHLMLIQGDAAAVRLFYKGRMDSMARELHVKPQQITGMYGAESEVSGAFTAPVTHLGINPVDGPGEVRHFEYEDSLISEEGWVDSARAEVQYMIHLKVAITTYWKRRWLLGKKHYFVDGYSPDPRVHIKDLTGVSIN